MMHWQEYESLLCDKCLSIVNETNQISQADLCPNCKASLNIREDEEFMAHLRRCGIKVD
jgi:hypothetical protein